MNPNQNAGALWSHPLHQLPNALSIVTPGLLVLPERHSHLTRIDPTTGATMWTVHVEDTWGWLACSSERAFYLNQHSRLQCHLAGTGEALWVSNVHGINGWLETTGQVILVGGWRGYTPLGALDAASGEPCWQLNWRGRQRLAKPVIGPWGIAVASLDAPLVRFLDPETGTLTGEVPLPVHGQEPDATSLLRRHGEALLLAGRDGSYHQLDSPRSSWRLLFKHTTGIATIAPPIVGDEVVFMDDAGRLNCYGLQDGLQHWTSLWHHNRCDRLPVALSPTGLLAVGSSYGRISLFEPAGGQVWSRVLAKRIETDMTWIDGRTLVAGTTNALVALRPPPGPRPVEHLEA